LSQALSALHAKPIGCLENVDVRPIFSPGGHGARFAQRRLNMAGMVRHDPFGDLVDDFFKGFLVRPVGYEPEEPVRRMRIEVREANGEYKLLAELPGVRKENIQVNIDGDQVTISAESRAEREAKEGERVLHSERYFGKVARAVHLGQEIDESKASARYADGVLELSLPRKAAAAAKQIPIQ
jgi:HSP20 family protein